MVQVRIIRSRPDTIEGEINAALKTLGSQPGIKIPSIDIKYARDPGNTGMDVAMIIYNAVRAQATKP